mgnify:CR=1 FL=1
MEVLILPAVVAIVTAVLLPRLAPIGHKALFMVATVPVLFYLYCLIVTPGWQPGEHMAAGA